MSKLFLQLSWRENTLHEERTSAPAALPSMGKRNLQKRLIRHVESQSSLFLGLRAQPWWKWPGRQVSQGTLKL